MSSRNVGLLPLMNLVRLKGVSILQQLHLEERLLRTSSQNWCIVNDGTNEPTIVMGISGKPAELLEIGSVLQDKIPYDKLPLLSIVLLGHLLHIALAFLELALY